MYKRRVVVEEGSAVVRQQARFETASVTPVVRSAGLGENVGRQSADKEGMPIPTFEDMKEPNVEIAMWTT